MFAFLFALAAAISVFFLILRIGGMEQCPEVLPSCILLWLLAFIAWVVETINASLPPV